MHARQVAPALRLEPSEDVVIDAQMNGSLVLRHADLSMPPEILVQLGRGRIGPRRHVIAALAHGLKFVA